MNLEKYFLLSKSKIFYIILAFIATIVIHNAIYGLTKFKEPLFFMIAVTIIPAYVITTVFYTILHHGGMKKHKKKLQKKSKRKKK